MVFTLAAFFIYQSRQAYHKEWEREAENFAHVLELSLTSTIRKTELLLQTVSHELAVHKEFRQRAELDHLLEIHRSPLPELLSLVIFDRNGKIKYQTQDKAAFFPPHDKKMYGRFLEADHAQGSYIVLPFAEQTSSQSLIGVAKRMTRPDGRNDGLLLGTFNLSHFASLLSDLKMGEHGVIALVSDSDAIVIRKREVLRVDMKNAQQGKYGNPLLEAFVKENRQSGVFRIQASTDGMRRVTAARRVGDYPLYVFVGMAEADYLAAWWRTVLIMGFFLLAFFLATVLMIYAINVGWFRRMQLLKAMEQRQRKFYDLAEMSSDWFWEFDEHYRFVPLGGDIGQIGSGPEVVGLSPWDIIEIASEAELDAFRRKLEAREPFQDFEYGMVNDRGERRYISVTGKPMFDEAGTFRGYHGTGRDITDKKRYEERIRQMAQYDSLTSLPNRSLFYDRLEHTISFARREQHCFAILYLDLDKFKPINDRYGHATGDELLKVVALRIRSVLRESDTVARFGGDEFVILLPQVTTLADAENVAEKIILTLTAPYVVDEVEEKIMVGVSIGIAFYPEDGMDGDSLMKAADVTMYKSKRMGNCYFFSDRFYHC